MKLAKLICCALLLVTFSQCKKKDTPQLPPATETGAMTFGCKINGEIFVPQDGRGKSGLRVEYVNLGDDPGGWYLNIPAIDWQSSSPLKGMHIETDSLLVIEGMTYVFRNLKGFPRAFYDATDTYLPSDNTGSIFIKKHDQINRILSATFSFTGINSTGEKVNITEGRFDVRY
jgi:hypothetical protein